jgi:hypothetical protein
MEAIQYRGYTIKVDGYGWYPRYKFFPTDEGENDDADYDGESFHYCGNARWADSLEEAKDEIWETVFQKMYPGNWEVRHSDVLPEAQYTWLEDALRFTAMFNGMPLFTFNAP